MAKGIIFLYNLILIIVYSGVLWMSFFLFMNGKDKILLWIGIIYGAIIIDDIVILLQKCFRILRSNMIGFL